VKWLVTGAHGMLGTDLVDLLRTEGYDVTAATRSTLDVTDSDAVDRAVAGHDVVVNCAAWTAVDAAEDHEDEALAVNADGARLLARAAAAHGARLVQVSTDYVFDGMSSTPYAEDAPTAPTSAYGRTKAAGEAAVREELPGGHLVVRTAWLYGAHGGCFPKTIARVALEKGQVSVITDQVGQPTWTADVAAVILALVRVDAPAGTYHATSRGRGSWFDFAQRVVVAAGLESSTVFPTTSDAYVRHAPRPSYSVLGHDALEQVGIEPIGDWESRWAEAATSVLL
jgi:dTDP-4-dehydrorhamnose reductase